MMPYSDHAKAFGVSTDAFFWYLTDRHGAIWACFKGFAYELPLAFTEVIDGE